ncbi:L-seryl-tRNA(Sec) selenium transferase [Candidatus Zixiibacteriota bacterium]|nr:L-seryl-tRNA(Sec) selenium transferase [candidate division Zixibacteria bacterium]
MDDFIIKSKRDIPAVEIVSSDEDLLKESRGLPRPLLVEIVRAAIETLKLELGQKYDEILFAGFKVKIITEIKKFQRKKIGRVINGTGILVHTNLGRAPLSEDLFNKIRNQITGYGNLEFEVDTGKRGRRGELAEKLLALLSGAEAGIIVNNNAAALFLILNTFANKKPVLISRGELVQIGGGFRIPDIIRRSGARLIEIGTTNITTLADYKEALEQEPALILKVHRSNFSVSGFTEEVTLKDLARLGDQNNLPVINDLGSGVFVDTSDFAGKHESTVQNSVRDGAALTCFSGDKLLGGVQAGLIVGQMEMITRLKKNPIYRALRVDKIIFSALEELLGYYLDDSWRENVKLWSLAAVRESEMYEKGRRLLKQVDAGDKIILEGSQGEMGGGSLPGVPLPSVALVFRSRLAPQKLAQLFRSAELPVIGRVTADNFIIDLKAIDDNEFELLAATIINLLPQI